MFQECFVGVDISDLKLAKGVMLDFILEAEEKEDATKAEKEQLCEEVRLFIETIRGCISPTSNTGNK